MPRRLWRILQHFYKPSSLRKWWRGYLQKRSWNAKILYISLGILAWVGRFFTKILDIIGIAEFWTFWWIVFNPRCRPMTELELVEVKRIFKDSIPYSLVHIHENSIIARIGARFVAADLGICTCYVIHFTRPIHCKEGNNDMAWLIHELVHVSQTEYVGVQYMPEAIYAQHTTGYDYKGPKGIEGTRFLDFNREQQGCIPADYYQYVLYDRSHPRFGYMSYSVYFPLIEELRKGEV